MYIKRHIFKPFFSLFFRHKNPIFLCHPHLFDLHQYFSSLQTCSLLCNTTCSPPIWPTLAWHPIGLVPLRSVRVFHCQCLHLLSIAKRMPTLLAQIHFHRLQVPSYHHPFKAWRNCLHPPEQYLDNDLRPSMDQVGPRCNLYLWCKQDATDDLLRDGFLHQFSLRCLLVHIFKVPVWTIL